ncbi:MAG: hypothetical protein ACK4YP_02325, partial [Myxococcota bacterium]
METHLFGGSRLDRAGERGARPDRRTIGTGEHTVPGRGHAVREGGRPLSHRHAGRAVDRLRQETVALRAERN